MNGFLWGAATSAHQVEGGCRHNDWWAWEAEGKIEGGARSGLSTDHFHRFKEDLELAASLKMNSYRFSLEWSRFEPSEGRWDSAAFDFYEAVLSECERRGLKPMVTLHHFTSPMWFAERGGFSVDGSVARFAAFVEKIAASGIGRRVPLWCTLNEPMALVAGSYLGHFMPPGEYAPQRASFACANLLRAHVAGYDLLHRTIRRREGPWRAEPLMVGFAHNMLDFRADRRWHPIERLLSDRLERLYNGAWLDAVAGKRQSFGLLGLLPRAPQVASARGRRTVDFIGVNYYTKAYVQWRPRAHDVERNPEVPVGVSFARRRELASDLGWAVHPEGFRRVLRAAAGVGVPVFVTENGVADRTDRLRGRFLLDHLTVLAEEMARGLDVRGYFHWSLLDNFEWIKGFWPRFGLFTVDYETLERTPTRSARLYRDIIEAHDGRAPVAATLGRMERILTKS